MADQKHSNSSVSGPADVQEHFDAMEVRLTRLRHLADLALESLPNSTDADRPEALIEAIKSLGDELFSRVDQVRDFVNARVQTSALGA